MAIKEENIEEIKKEYFNFLRDYILTRLDNLEEPELIELKILLYDVRSNLELMLQDEETFNEDIITLMKYSKTRRK